jgi:signal transduction histidine kinase
MIEDETSRSVVRESADHAVQGEKNWRETLLHWSLVSATALATVAFPVIGLQALKGSPTLHHATAVGFYLILLAATFLRRLPFLVRVLALLLSLGGFALFGFVRVGYQVGPSLGTTLVVVFAGLLLGPRVLIAAFTASVLAILGIGAFQTHTDASLLAPHVGDPTLFANWLRVAAAYALFTGVLAAAVMFVVSHHERVLRDRTDALERLKAATAGRQEAEQALDTAQRTITQMQKLEAIGRLAGGVAHDFNNALVVILGWADLLRAKPAGGAYLQAGLNEIVAAGNRAASLTQQLLAFGRQGRLVPRAISPTSLIAELVRMLERLLPANIQLETRVGAGVRSIFADPSQMHQVLLNLCLNARDAMPQGGTLEISAYDFEPEDYPDAPPGSWVVVRVRDTGVGMDAETQARAFEPFFTTKGELGSGLGLASVYGIVKQSGGHVLLQSRPDDGSTFSLLLPPCAAEHTGVQLRGRSQPAVDGGSRPSTILIAEDEPAVRNLMVTALKAAGHTVLAAAHGGAALELARRYRGKIDLLCTDGMMPGISSANLIADFRVLFPGARVLLCSGHVDQRLRAELPAEELRYLNKPFTGDALAETVADVLTEGSAA